MGDIETPIWWEWRKVRTVISTPAISWDRLEQVCNMFPKKIPRTLQTNKLPSK